MSAPRTTPVLDDQDYERVRMLVREHSGLELREAGRGAFERAVRGGLAEAGLSTPAELCELMSRAEGRNVLEGLLGALPVGESHFFRTRAQFEALRRDVLPELIGARRESRRLRVWSAGCATGQEPYSIAILLERLLPDIDGWDVRILGTDISTRALETARQGRYRRWSFREVPEEIERAYFIARGEEREVIPRIRKRVHFARLNLVGDRYPSPLSNTADIDLVLCRNVLIYFESSLATRVVGRLADALADGGWLVLAPAEVAIARGTGLAPTRLEGALMHRKMEVER
jgi:chemotaxis protein methyltransferase CheR